MVNSKENVLIFETYLHFGETIRSSDEKEFNFVNVINRNSSFSNLQGLLFKFEMSVEPLINSFFRRDFYRKSFSCAVFD